jgi:guanine nucleotide-binding protein subunit beta-2-like 1 protein
MPFTLRETLNGHSAGVTCVATAGSPGDASYIVLSGARDDTLILWAPVARAAAAAAAEGEAPDTPVQQAEQSEADGGAVPKSAPLAPRLAVRRRFLGHLGVISAVAIAPDASFAVTASWDRSLRLWSLTSDGDLAKVKMLGHTDAVLSCAVSPCGTWVLSGGRDNTVRLWRAADGVCTCVVAEADKGHGDWVSSVCFSPSGVAWTASLDRFIKSWRVADGELTLASTFGQVETPVTSITLSPDGSLLASATKGGVVSAWDCGGSVNSSLYNIATESVLEQVGFNPARYWLSCVSEARASVLDLETKAFIMTTDGTAVAEGVAPSLSSAVWSTDGREYIVGFGDAAVRIWRLDE